MNGGRCHRRKMMGSEGGCGAEELPCPISRASSHAAASTTSREVGLGHYVQARKALSERSPFEEEEVLARVASLPVALAAALSRSSDGRRKHRKAHAEHAKDPSAQPAPAVWSIWNETEDYFRPITLADIDNLEHKLPVISGSAMDSCLTIPLLRGEENQTTGVSFAAEGCRNLAESSVAAKGTEVILEFAMNDGVLVKQQHEEALRKEQQATEVVEQQQQATEVVEQQEEATEVVEQQQQATEVVEQQEEATEVVEQQQQATEVVEQQQQKGQDEEHDCGQQAMEVDRVTIDGAVCGTPAEKGENLVDYSSLNWILCSRNRALLASERPNKKRKLLGRDAGLERLLILPHLQKEESLVCDYCCLGNYDRVSNRFLHCASCKMSVHMKCYGVRDAPEDTWLCSWCRRSEVTGSHKDRDEPGPCLLCPKRAGALKPVEADNSQSRPSMKFAHLFCSLWMPEVHVGNVETMEPIRNAEKVQETRKRLVCNVCKVKQGACIRCSHGTCRTSFHPVCAKDARQRMEIWGKRKSDDVELRAFCSKHSTFQDVDQLELRKDPTKLTSDCSSLDNGLSAKSLVTRIPKIKITRREVDKSIVADHAATSCFVSVSGNETPLDQEKSEVKGRPRSNGALLNQNMLIDGESCNAVENSASDVHDLSTSLKKLFDCEKVDVADVALKMQVPSDSLELALAGDTSSLSYELKLKIIKWLQDYVQLGCHIRHLNSTSGCALSVSPKKDDFEDTNDTKVTGLTALDAVLVKSLPPRRRTKSNIRILKDNKVVCASGEAFPDGYSNSKVINESVGDKSGEDEVTCNGPLFHDQDCCDKEQNILKKMQDDISGCSDASSFDEKHQHGNGSLTALDNHDVLTHHKQHSHVERVSAFQCCVNQDVKLHNSVKPISDDVSRQEKSEHDGGEATTGASDVKTVEPCSTACIHPFIEKKMIEMWNNSEADPNGQVEQFPTLDETDSSKRNYYYNQSLNSSSANQSCRLDDKKLQQLAEARGLGIMELSPEDEVEGEIIYLQNKLLDTAVSIKHSFENLIMKVVRHLPEELDSLKKKRWDMVVVNQFLRHVKEAKKRGRKEKRHKEYQAVLAAAAAAVETSSRISSLRKDQNDARAEVDAGSRRSGTYPPVSKAKETLSKLASSKNSSEKRSEANASLCDICGRAETMLNRIFLCGGCKVAVHLDCYRRPRDPISSWFCDVCEELQSNSSSHELMNGYDWGKFLSEVQCVICGVGTGAFRKTVTGQWVHNFCAEWLLESTFRRGQENPIEGMESILKERVMLYCCICHQNTGICMKCSYGHCQTAFHPFCARNVGLFMTARTINGKLQHKAYCEKHGTEQRQKADVQQYGAEELTSIKQIRVELEKVRLLCERIIRREKLKRELVLCSHDILASRRDYVAFSLLVNSSFFPPGVSSESATTSINNRSYSDTVQRSDDVTVDSSVSIKRKIRLPLQTEIDRKIEDSSTSRLVLTRKGTERMAFSGKQIPHRPASVTSCSTIDEGKKLKPRKHMEVFQKEVIMTSDQASIQNRRLPKGFVYVPVDSLPKTRNIDTREPRKPDG